MIDWSRVDELRNEVCASDFTEVVDLPSSPASDSHSPVMVSPMARSFSVKCRNGEKMAAEGRASDIDLAELAIEFQRSKAAFLNGLGK